ncbi:MAG: mannose-1-phosphate guanylyltransferase [Planctomycetes bacterium]|nr:mannose-1-phosphate guanylyltransferase [Planctomycetota bacterium]
MRHAVIMAGGVGVRLWPLSRKQHPKQLLRLFKGTSLLRQSYERVATLLDPGQIHVITSQAHLGVVAKELPELPAANLIGEPAGRNTANAVGLAAAVIARREPDVVIGMFTADHIITPVDRFSNAVERAYQIAEEHRDALVTMGIKPSRPDTNYGYVQRGERIADGVHEVKLFTEKPGRADAEEYVSSGEYYWNSGMFAWQASTILEQLQKHLPGSFNAVREIAAAWDTGERQQKLADLYPSLTSISIDFAVMEKADRVLVVEMDCDWVDVGSWPAIEAVIPADADGNLSACERVMHLASRGNIVVSEEKHLIATIGVDDLVIVHSPDATLICKKSEAASIKEMVDKVHEEYGDTYA